MLAKRHRLYEVPLQGGEPFALIPLFFLSDRLVF
jgi:hypothetical protein